MRVNDYDNGGDVKEKYSKDTIKIQYIYIYTKVALVLREKLVVSTPNLRMRETMQAKRGPALPPSASPLAP